MKIAVVPENDDERIKLGAPIRVYRGCFEFAIVGMNRPVPGALAREIRHTHVNLGDVFGLEGRLYAALKQIAIWEPSPTVQPPTDS